jgi:hypothetical protein
VPASKTQTLTRAVDTLDCFSADHRQFGVREVARQLEAHPRIGNYRAFPLFRKFEIENYLKLMVIEPTATKKIEFVMAKPDELAIARSFLAITNPIYPQNVVGQAHQDPLRLDFLQASKQ